MPKSKHSPEFRAKVSQEYLDGIGSIQFLADKYSIGYSTLKGWINEYQIHGIAAFCHPSNRNRTYSKEFKLRCVEAVLNGEGTVDDIIAKYAISSRSVLRSWIKVYNANREFKDYNPKAGGLYGRGTKKNNT
ncbi:MAG: transposase [Blautia faecis]